MTLVEAIKTGKPMKRPEYNGYVVIGSGMRHGSISPLLEWEEKEQKYDGGIDGMPKPFSPDDILANDWEIKPDGENK